jgi:guanine nucleotide-binding protein subunit alpha
MTTKFRSKRPGPPNPAGYNNIHDDPLTQAMMPPTDESPEDRVLRLERAQEATRVSREIDESIQESRKAHEKRKKAIKVLLLGESFTLCVANCPKPLSFIQAKPNRERVLH